jgi:hypothetical protein
LIGARIIVNLRVFDFFWVKVAITNHVLLNLLLLIMFLLKLIFFFAHPPLPKTFDQSVLLFFFLYKKTLLSHCCRFEVSVFLCQSHGSTEYYLRVVEVVANRIALNPKQHSISHAN